MLRLSRRAYLLATICLASCFTVGLTDTAAGGVTQLNPGDKVVFFGDSITQAGAEPGGYVTLVQEAIARDLKDQNITVIGAGVSGNKVPDLQQRLALDVLKHKPKVVVIYIGINDVWHSTNGKGTKKEDYEKGLKWLISRINEEGGRVILCTPSVIGEKTDGTNQLEKMLDEYSQISRNVAKETESQLLDLRLHFANYLKEHNKDNLGKNILTTDGVHLNAAGNRFLADKMLEALGVTGHVGKQLRHVVLFKFKDDVTPAQVQEVVTAFSALPGKINSIVGFETGTDVSVEMKADGFTHAFLVTFADEKGRETYLPHPDHQEFVKLVGPRVDKVLVFDYWTK